MDAITFFDACTFWGITPGSSSIQLQGRVAIVKLLRAIPGVACREPKGAFYAFPDVSAYVGKKSPDGKILADDVQLCDWLVDVGKVAVVPGSGFGAPGFVRLSYACSMQNIEVGVDRLAKSLAQLS